MAGTAAAVSEASIAPRTRTLGPFLIGFNIVFLRSSGAGTAGADAGAVCLRDEHLNLTGDVSEISVWACYADLLRKAL